MWTCHMGLPCGPAVWVYHSPPLKPGGIIDSTCVTKEPPDITLGSHREKLMATAHHLIRYLTPPTSCRSPLCYPSFNSHIITLCFFSMLSLSPRFMFLFAVLTSLLQILVPLSERSIKLPYFFCSAFHLLCSYLTFFHTLGFRDSEFYFWSSSPHFFLFTWYFYKIFSIFYKPCIFLTSYDHIFCPLPS